MNQIEDLDWDSEFFELKVGRVIGDSSLNLKEVIDKSNSYDLVYVFSENPLDDNRLKLVDEKITYELMLKDISNNETAQSMQIFPYTSKKIDIDKMKTLAREAGVFSRFYTDNKIDKKYYNKLYDRWMENSLKKDLAVEVFVSLVDNLLAGMITIQEIDKDTSRIGLIATSKQMRGKGIASALINSAIIYSRNKGYKSIEVVTQKKNLPANKLYDSKGFNFKHLQYIYHLWNI